MIEARAMGDRARGPIRWHYQDRKGALPWVMVNEDAARHLESGEYAIAEGGAIVHRAVAMDLRSLDAELVRFLNDG